LTGTTTTTNTTTTTTTTTTSNNNNNNNANAIIQPSHSTGLTCVYACGPKPLIESCEEISLRFSNLHFKKEYFDL